MIYLDSAATRGVLPEVRDLIIPYLTEKYGNPSAHYSIGIEASDDIKRARAVIAETIGCEPSEIYFTSGGTEADEWALYGRDGVLTTDIEHHAILRNLPEEKAIIPIIHLTKILENSAKFFTKKYKRPLVSVMYTNNEIGLVNPIDEVSSICKDVKIPFHTDAVQAFGHQKIDLKNIDYMSVSGHKIGAMKGVGFLYVKHGMIPPMIRGGMQESGHRAGTENVAGIVSLAKATELAYSRVCIPWRQIFIDMLKGIPQVHINGITGEYQDNIVSVRFDGYRGEELQAFLNEFDICVGTGSACNSNDNKPSHVLKAIGLSDEQANSTLRFSFTENTRLSELETTVSVLKQGLEVLRS